MSFKNIIGQDRPIQFLKQCLASGRLNPALLFSGPPGVGKRRTARELAKALNCAGKGEGSVEPCDVCLSCRKIDAQTHPDVLEVDLARQAEWLDEKVERQTALKIELVRMIDRHASLKASEGSCRVAVFDPAQDLTEEAANALLKLLEEPPPHFQIVLIVEDEAATLATIRSRCTLVRFGRIPVHEIAHYLEQRLNLLPEEARAISERSGGSLGKALWEKEWVGWEVLAFEEMDLPAAFKWIEQFDTRQGGRAAAQVLVGILIRKESDRLAQESSGRPFDSAQDRLRALLTASAALKQNVSPRLALEALYLRFKRIERSPGSLRPVTYGDDD